MKNLKQNIKNRSPIISMLGHVNHGKTSILRKILSLDLKEVGNITQNIKYFYTKTKYGYMTFIDTPGHEIFYSIRNLGATITDIILLIIASDDDIKEQTIESINYIKDKNIPAIIVLNKIDKLNSNTNKILNKLSEYDIISQEWGGKYIFAYTSTINNSGIDKLIEYIYLESKKINLLSYYEKDISKGIIIESFLDKKKGLIVVLIVKEGSFIKGNYISSEIENSKIKSISMMNNLINISYPSEPIEIIGLSKIPRIGSFVYSYKNLKYFNRNIIYKEKNKIINNNIYKDINFKQKDILNINLILKSDKISSYQSLLNRINKIKFDNLKINILNSNIGLITNNDINKSVILKSILIAFNIKVDKLTLKLININKIKFIYSNTVYDLLDKLNNVLLNLVNISKKNNISFKGECIIKNIFNIPKIGIIIGCKVTNGYIDINNNIIIIRNNIKIYEGKIVSIKLFNKDINRAKSGIECGLKIDNFNDFKINDKIKSFIINNINEV